MTDWARDPMGFNLMACNKPKKEEKKEQPKPKSKEAEKPTAAAAQPVYYIMPHQHQNQFYVQPFCPMPMFVQQQIYSYPAYPMLVAQPAKPAEKPAAAKVKPAHVCVNCNEKKKCKACVKAQESKKKYVSKPTFLNPRTLKK